MPITVIKFEEEFFQDVANLFAFFRVPDTALLRVKPSLKSVKNPLTDENHMRPMTSICFESELEKDDLVHVIEMLSGDKIKVAITERDMKQFANKESGYEFNQDAAFLQSIRDSIIARKNTGAW